MAKKILMYIVAKKKSSLYNANRMMPWRVVVCVCIAEFARDERPDGPFGALFWSVMWVE